eukprot:10475696-Alexandrium_andersonii.AAC.1
MSASLVGSEMCIRDSFCAASINGFVQNTRPNTRRYQTRVISARVRSPAPTAKPMPGTARRVPPPCACGRKPPVFS